MSRFGRLLNVAKSATPEALDRYEQILYPYLARGIQSGELLESNLEYILKALSKSGGVSFRIIQKAYRAVAKANPKRNQGAEQSGPYLIQNGTICVEKDTRDGPVTVPLCNFTARITEQRERDDGVETTFSLVLEGSLASGQKLPEVEVTALEFGAMNWPVSKWGAQAIVYAGQGTKDLLRTAIQQLSSDMPRRTTFTHLGWRKRGDEHLYLHAGGAIGADGPVPDIQVDPPLGLELFILPEPPKGETLRYAVRKSLETLDLAPDEITVPLHAAIYRSVLGGADFGLHLAGQTGAGKSELAAVMQQHLGAGLDSRHLPGSWSSTANALEGLAFFAKDALIVIDDFAPEGTANDIARMHTTAARLLRAQGNGSARGRMRADGSLRAARPPRGMVLSTGEDTPKGHSINARTLVLEMAPGALNWTLLSEVQTETASGTYAKALVGFLQWLAKDYDQRLETFKTDCVALRASLQQGGHKRTVDAGAQLLASFRTFLTFALEVGALSEAEHDALWQRVQVGIHAALEPQVALQAQRDPVLRAFELLTSIFLSGRAHVVDATVGGYPGEGWGWETSEAWGGPVSRSKGTRIGWVED